MFKKFLGSFILIISILLALTSIVRAENSTPLPQENPLNQENDNYLQPVIGTEAAIEVQKSNIFDASQSFIANPDKGVKYEWDFGDGNRNEGVEVLHVYKNPGKHIITLKISNGNETAETKLDVFVYNKLIVLITDQTENQDSIKIFQNIAEKNGVFMKVIESFGSSTEFISEEILTKKLTEQASILQKGQEIVIWTKENAGLNALSRFIQNNSKNLKRNLSDRIILVIENDLRTNLSRAQRQFKLLDPQKMIISKEATIDDLIKSKTSDEFLNALNERGRSYKIIDAKSGKIFPWNFMSYLVNVMINNGIPDNTIALLLLLPVIATVVAFMRQVVGVTTFGIYTPSIITLSFLIIGIQAGLLTLLIVIGVGAIARELLKKVHILFIPKMAIVMTLVSLTLFLVLIASIYLDFFDSDFLSIAIFPMLILSTLVEKFVSSKGEKSFSSATMIMGETLIVAIIAYFFTGGEIDLFFITFKFEFVKRMMLNYPEIILLLIVANVALGKWSGLRILERIRFREILRHIEE